MPPVRHSDLGTQMHSLLFTTTVAAALTRTVASLSLPFYPSILQLPSTLNGSLPALIPSNSTTSLLDSWPKLPFHVLISETKIGEITETTWMIIHEYLEAPDVSVKGEVISNISLIVDLVDSYEPDHLIDNRRVITSGLVSVRFPAVQARNAQRMTNGLAVELLGAAWQLQYARGPRGWKLATIKTVRGRNDQSVVGFFSLWIGEGGADTRTSPSVDISH